jgi:uncharacterized protein
MKKDTSKLLLLDLNVLLAVAWPNHQFHRTATHYLESTPNSWATCAFTEIGFIRLSSNPAVVPTAKSPAEAAVLLAAILQDSRHVYIGSLPSPAEDDFLAALQTMLGHHQVTDGYLLGVARRHKATFLTFDARLQGLAGDTHVKILGAEIVPPPAPERRRRDR